MVSLCFSAWEVNGVILSPVDLHSLGLTDDSKPFSWSGAGQKLFNQEEGEEDGEEVTQGDDPHFEPVVPLPDLVEVKTGNLLIYPHLSTVIIRCCI